MDEQSFLDSSKLYIIVPQRTAVGPEELFQASHANATALQGGFIPLSRIEPRSLLFFDELLTVYVAFETVAEGKTARELADCISVGLDLRAYGNAPKSVSVSEDTAERSPSRNEDIIWSGNIQSDVEPYVLLEKASSERAKATLIWTCTVEINRPRIRLQSPMIDIQAVATIYSGNDNALQIEDPFLSSGIPGSINLLKPLSQDPYLNGPPPRLTATRLSRMQLDRGGYERKQFFQLVCNSSFRAVPAMASRIHYTRSKNNAGKASLVASLDIEMAPYSSEDIQIASVSMSLSEGITEDLVNSHVSALRTYRPKDIAVFLFRLTLENSPSNESSFNPGQSLDVAVDAIVLFTGSCNPRITMRWKTGVDFSAALNPSYGTPGQSMQRSRRPANLPFPPAATSHSTTSVTNGDLEERPPSPSGLPKRQRALSVGDLGVTVTFTAPTTVLVGNAFKWQVLTYNGSSRPRRLAVIAIPHRKRDFKGHRSTPSSSSSGGAGKTVKRDVPDAVIDENLLYALHKGASNLLEPQWQVVCLSTEIRLGLLNPGACADFELEFLPLAEGSLQLEAVRVTDTASGDTVDVRDLPDIRAVDKGK